MGQVRSTVNSPVPRLLSPFERLLVDKATGAPVGIQNLNAGGEDAYFIPIELTVAQIESPTADMLADVKVTYCLNEAPYTRYRSNGTILVSIDGSQSFGNNSTIDGSEVIDLPSGSQAAIFGTLTVSDSARLTVEGEIRVGAWPF